MSIQILGGQFKGQRLTVLNHSLLRPTSVLLRRKIFDAFQGLEEQIFVDACAGSGGMGLEAASRGAELVFFNEKNPKIFKQLKQNVSNIMGVEKKHYVLSCSDLKVFLQEFRQIYQTWSAQQQKDCIFFLDPPYQLVSLYQETLHFLADMNFQGILWLEGDKKEEAALSSLIEELVESHKTYMHSDHFLTSGKVKLLSNS